jgi:hypothetical protein
MTRRPFRFTWMDDDRDKVERYRNAIEKAELEGFPMAEVDAVIVERNVIDSIEALEKYDRRADLIIMDHVFSRARGTSLKLDGASAAHLVREMWPEVPIVCVTAMLPDRPKKLDQEDLSEYIAVYAYGDLADELESLFAIARDFKKLRKQRGDFRRHLVELLKAPKSEREALTRALPNEFRSQTHATTQHRVASWILSTFMGRPGFLYDGLRAATLIGLSEQGFSKVEELFASALYRGPFATAKHPRWWLRDLVDLVYSKAQDNAGATTQLAGRSLPGISANDHSLCYVNTPRGDIPDVVARLTPGKELRAVASKHTRRDPEDAASVPGFESLFIIEG